MLRIFLLISLIAVSVLKGHLTAQQLDTVTSNPAQMLEELNAMTKTVLLNPVESVILLDAYDQTTIQSNKPLYLIWLLRKIEASNYSYQFELFEATLSRALLLIDSSTSPNIRSRLLIFESISKRRLGNYQKSFQLLERAALVASQSKDDLAYVAAQVEYGYTLSLAEQYEPALLELQKAYVVGLETKDPFTLAVIEEVYGALYGYMDKIEDSLSHYKKSYELYQRLNYPHHIGESAYGIASTYRYAGATEDAIKWFNIYRNEVEGLDKIYTQFFYQYGIGMTYAELKDCERALGFFSDALSIKGFTDYKAEIWKKSAICFAENKNFNDANNAIAQARLLLNQMPALKGTSWELEVDKLEADIIAMQGDFQTAYPLLKAYYRKSLMVNDQNTSERIQRIKLSMQQERSELEFEHLENESQLQQLKLKDQMQHIKGQKYWLYVTIFFICFILGIVWWQFMVSKKFKSLSITDELTGLSNRRFIFTTIERLLSRKQTKDIRYSIMLIDVDDLKPINDQYGHQDGDKVLKMVADSGRSALRDGDIFARIGGDEFMLFLTRSDPVLDEAIATRIMQTINQTSVTMQNGKEINISVSIGIATINDLSITPETLYAQVDSALYDAKASGRNQIKHWLAESA